MKTAILFSGQGSQYPGMMKDLFVQYPSAGKAFDLAKEVYGRDLYNFLMNTSQEELNETQNTQPCLLTAELALLCILQEWGIPYDAAVGFSLGEWAALVAAGVIAPQDALGVVEKRADAMQQAVPLGKGGMAAILGKDESYVRALCQQVGQVTPANYNCPGNISVAGTAEAIARFLEKAEQDGAMVRRLSVSIPSHCRLMEPAAEKLRPVIGALPMDRPEKALIMNASGKREETPERIKTCLLDQLTHPVLFQQSVELLLEEGYDTFFELGPGKTLCDMVKRTAKAKKAAVTTFPFSDLETADKIRKAFS